MTKHKKAGKKGGKIRVVLRQSSHKAFFIGTPDLLHL
jgi:hypothetical protein